jgi:hypothetical protein
MPEEPPAETQDADGGAQETGEGTAPPTQQEEGGNEPQTAGADPQTGPSDEVGKLRREAASYRTRLREQEAETKRLADRLDDVQRRGIEQQITGPGRLHDGADLWREVSLDDLRDEQGAVDEAKVKAALDQVLTAHPHWRDKSRTGFGGGARQDQDVEGPSFGEALKGATATRP